MPLTASSLYNSQIVLCGNPDGTRTVVMECIWHRRNELDPRTQSHAEVLKSFCTGNLQCLGTSVRASRSMASAVITHQSTQVYGSIVGTCHMGSDISQRTAFLLYYYYLTFFLY
jgi:hypothetical protein